MSPVKPWQVAVDFLEGLLRALGEEGRVEVREEKGRIYIDIRGRFSLIPGEDKAFREALARLVRLRLGKAGMKVGLVLDVNGALRAREEALATRARELARRAVRERRRIELEPMPPRERRIVHLALADFPGVRTYSVGEGEKRHVVIEPTG